MEDSVKRREAPFASHLLYTQATKGWAKEIEAGEDPTHWITRDDGIRCGSAWRRIAAKTVLYTDRGISSGMRKALDEAEGLGQPVERRMLQGKEGDYRVVITHGHHYLRGLAVTIDLGDNSIQGFAVDGAKLDPIPRLYYSYTLIALIDEKGIDEKGIYGKGLLMDAKEVDYGTKKVIVHALKMQRTDQKYNFVRISSVPSQDEEYCLHTFPAESTYGFIINNLFWIPYPDCATLYLKKVDRVKLRDKEYLIGGPYRIVDLPTYAVNIEYGFSMDQGGVIGV